MLVTNCVFCELSDRNHGEDWGYSIVFEPLNPVTPGHLLVVPREHLCDATQEPNVTAEVMRVASIVARRYKSANIITSIGEPATQSVFHLHIHVVPREKGDGLTLPWTGQKK